MKKAASKLEIRPCELEDDVGIGIQESLLGDYVTINKRLKTTMDKVNGLIRRSAKDKRCFVVNEDVKERGREHLRGKELKSERWIKLAEKLGVRK